MLAVRTRLGVDGLRFEVKLQLLEADEPEADGHVRG